MDKTISFVCLIICTFIWGTTFIAQDTGMDNIGPFTFNAARFFVGFQGQLREVLDYPDLIVLIHPKAHRTLNP